MSNVRYSVICLWQYKVVYVFADRLPFVEHMFYDNSYKPRSISHKCIKTLDKLVELGESVTDEQLQEAKSNVKPEFVLQNFLTSVSIL